MSKIKENFIGLVRKKTVKSPIERGFTLQAWEAAWNQIDEKSASDVQLYQAGVIFYRILTSLRDEIKSLYQTPAKAGKKAMIKACCGMANRDRFILSKSRVDTSGDLAALRNSSNMMSNELSHIEIANGCVDGIEIAIRQLILNKVPLEPYSRASVDAFSFLLTELNISQVYGLYESYWRSLVWGDYEFRSIDEFQYEIRQIPTAFIISYEGSQLRKEKLLAAAAMYIHENLHRLPQLGKNCLILVRKQKKITVSVTTVKSLPKEYQKMAYVLFDYQKAELLEHLPKEFFTNNANTLKINILEIIEVFQLLVTLSHLSSDNFPSNDEVYTINKAGKFSPSINQNDLIRGINQATGWEFKKCERILEFLTFDGDKDKDLWCHPVIKLGDGEVTYSTAALASPVLIRAVEHWLTQLNITLREKGAAFEKSVIDSINNELSNNSLFADHEQAVGGRFNLGKSENEEVDLLFRFGNTIVIGEVKSIVTTDSPLSLFRTKEIIFHAAEQAKRKANFLTRNLEEMSNRLNWKLNPEKTFTIIPLIITSNSICAGYVADDVPVCDLTIMEKYFESNIVPLFTTSPKKHIAWFEIYNDFESAQENFAKYLLAPPQIQFSKKDFEEQTFRVPVKINPEAPEFFSFTRLVKKNMDIQEFIQRDFQFPLKLSDDFAEELSKVEFIL